MINRASIAQWKAQAPWNTSEQVEQDLIICRALIAIFSDELLGTKLRAIYQRKKGRDLFDLYKALSITEVNPEVIIRCYKRYMDFSVSKPPTYRQFIQNMESKMIDPDFMGDMENLLHSDETYDIQEAYEIVKEKIIDRLIEQ